ncbi:MAG: TIR domain-containing protein [Clostridia bacterium]|nr:TIR domain-containing protein [Clostridia bacterium]
MRTNDFFISYNKNDYIIVEEIVNKMEFYGAKCWFQRRNSKQAFAHAIAQGIESAGAFVVFVSSHSIRSIFVQNEIKSAIDHLEEDSTYKVLPIILGDVDEQSQEFRALSIFLGTFNMLYAQEFQSTEELVLKIFDQVDMKIINENNQKSIYTGDSDIEKQRLKIQTALLNKYAQDYIIDILDGKQNPTILDIGCSDGDCIMSRVEGIEYGYLLGVDINSDKIKDANDKYGNEKNTFWKADITKDEFFAEARDYLKDRDLSGFDLIHISAVLLHLDNVERIMGRIHDLLKRGGHVFIQEEDDGLNLAYPHFSYFEKCACIYEHSLESGDRKMGRKVPMYLKNAGFSNIVVKNSTITSEDFGGSIKEELWDLYYNPNYWDATSASYFDDIIAVEMLPTVIAEHDEIKEEYMKGNIFITLGILFFDAEE